MPQLRAVAAEARVPAPATQAGALLPRTTTRPHLGGVCDVDRHTCQHTGRIGKDPIVATDAEIAAGSPPNASSGSWLLTGSTPRYARLPEGLGPHRDWLRARELVDVCLGDVSTVSARLRDVGVGDDDGDR